MDEWKCLICGKPTPDYTPYYCCNSLDCNCQGMPMEPPICSDKCWDAMLVGIGKPFDERRKDAGIEIYKE